MLKPDARWLSAKILSSLPKGFSSIPDIGPDDTLFWHYDVVRAVESEHQGEFDSKVMNTAADDAEVSSGGRADGCNLMPLRDRQMRRTHCIRAVTIVCRPPCWLCRGFSSPPWLALLLAHPQGFPYDVNLFSTSRVARVFDV
ncbi:YbiU family protein [Erwinia tasmaniensis]|uniref:Uncharacterized protein n=1 Tax=Erwinia tasmaniensis (strain DSM 17950 / CFBP 7177 / CIP 109463 / NCPPB 4357 / Et1/99) TaxID=465817 RepID=B2VDX6_ERWT9|nr:Hypothetical protein ETA_11170 [Erwinia tasmaniensis Et1/99]